MAINFGLPVVKTKRVERGPADPSRSAAVGVSLRVPGVRAMRAYPAFDREMP